SHLINAAVRGGINLNHVKVIAGADLNTGVADATRLRLGAISSPAVERHGQNTGDGGLSDAPMPAEDVAVGYPLLLDGIFQGAGNVLLPDHVRKALRTVLTGEDLITHRETRL